MHTNQVRRLAIATIVAAGGLSALAVPAHAADTSQVSVVHGIPNTPVDVYVNGKKTLPNFQPGKVAGPLTLPAGSYDLALTKVGDPLSAAILKVNNAKVPGGANISLVAHLTAAGKPTITPFVNDVSKLDAGQARLIVRHTAAAPSLTRFERVAPRTRRRPSTAPPSARAQTLRPPGVARTLVKRATA